MSIALIVYLAGVIANLGDTLGGFQFLCAIVTVASAFATGIAYSESAREFTQKSVKILKVAACLFVISGALQVFIPSERTMWIMAGAQVGQTAVTSQIGQDVLTIVQEKVTEIKKQVLEEAKEVAK